MFNAEIAHYSSPWDWMMDRIDMGFYVGLNDSDFIPMTAESETHEMQIAGMNTYTRTTDQNLGNHIDFISRDCYSQTVQWNTTNNNNGTAEQPFPYLASNVKQFLDQLYNKLPADVKQFIVSKRTFLERRYSSGGVLKKTTSWGWMDIGKLWLPNEYEVFDNTVWATKGWSAGQAMQYPIFANSYKNRIKGAGSKGVRCNWWLLSVGDDSSIDACSSSSYGYANLWEVSGTLRVPICFRLARQAQS